MESVIYKVIKKLLSFGIKEIDLILLRDVCKKNWKKFFARKEIEFTEESQELRKA